MAEIVFVYGTLRRGEVNHQLLATARFIGEARTPPRYDLVDMGGFPALVAGGWRAIAGELYAVDAATLRRLDELEGHPHLYRRCRVTLADGRRVLVYLLPAARARGRPILDVESWSSAGG